MSAGDSPHCPRCTQPLETQPDSRFSPHLILDATAHDLVCKGCQRLWCVIRHTPRSLRLLRMRRLIEAVRAVDEAGEAQRTASGTRKGKRRRVPLSHFHAA